MRIRIRIISMWHYHLSTRCDGSTFFAVGVLPFGTSLSKKFELSVLTRSILWRVCSENSDFCLLFESLALYSLYILLPHTTAHTCILSLLNSIHVYFIHIHDTLLWGSTIIYRTPDHSTASKNFGKTFFLRKKILEFYFTSKLGTNLYNKIHGMSIKKPVSQKFRTIFL